MKEVGKFIFNLLSAYGLLWGLVEIIDFFAGKEISDSIKPFWWLFLLLGLLYAAFRSWPKSCIRFNVPNRDAKVNLNRKDIFKIKGSLIVPVNNQFKINQDGDLLRSKSILAQTVKKFYKSRSEHLQADIDSKLTDAFYKDYKNGNEYKIGTVVPIIHGERKFYFLANTKINNQNKSFCNDDIFEQSLNELWVYLSECASKEDLIIPLIGTGNGRLGTDRSIVYKEILLSFLSSLSQKNYADSLSICLHPPDIKKYKMNFLELARFTDAKVSYQEYETKKSSGTNKM